MGVLSKIEPQEVFAFFEDICNIPHGSGNVGQISNYLKKFAQKRKLFCLQDDFKNIIIVKEATKGYENEEPMILQGHMDMVAVKKPGLSIDMEKEPLKLMVEGDTIYAEGTSLGGDDGIAVAYALALLDSQTIPHPKLEVIITVDEEVGMNGAREIDLSMLTGHRMLNLDSEEEGIFLASCAGGARADCRLPLHRESVSGKAYQVKLCGLQGGHSGVEIHKERGNANGLMGRVLYRVINKTEIALVSLRGGLADNAIPREATAVVIPKDAKVFEQIIRQVEEEIRDELATKDKDVHIDITPLEEGKYDSIVNSELEQAVSFVYVLPNGVQAMSKDKEGLVETSLNLGVLELRESELTVAISVRSSVESAKNVVLDQLRILTKMAGGSCEITGDYPGWAYRVHSPLREKMVEIYEEMYGKKPEIQAIHAGVECGILSAKIPDLDCISLGPDMKDIHTTEETLSISSTKRVWEYLLEVLKRK